MEITVVRSRPSQHATPLLAVPLFEGEGVAGGVAGEVDQAIEGHVGDVVGRGDFKGKEGQTLVLYPRAGAAGFERLLLVGLGKRADFDAERLRRFGGTVAKQAAKLEIERVAVALPEDDRIGPEPAGRAVAEGLVLGAYVFDEFKTTEGDNGKKPARPATAAIVEPDEARTPAVESGARVGAVLGRAAGFARDLGNLPGNVATPTYLAERAIEMGSRLGMQVTVLGPAELEREGLRLLLAVSRGSVEEPRLIVIEHRGGEGTPVALVGKGLTFDAGGISIKPAAGMEDMKFDMCGGAAVLAAMQAIGELRLPVNVVGIVPSSENLLAGGAMKPGDVLRSHAGKTVEVVNTDAEGRLILADALSYVKRFEPAAIVDAATLTGACVVALGHHATAGLGNDEALLAEVRGAGDRAGERVWPMPMFSEYREQIRSDYADIKNSGGRPGGLITAGWFLREFVGDTPWVHLDVAGTAYGDGKLAYQAKGATGVPTRLFVEWVLSRAG